MTRPSAPGARRSARISAIQTRSVASKTASSRFEAVSSGPKRRNVDGLARMTSRSHVPEHPGRLAGRSCPARRPRRRSRGSPGSAQVVAAAGRRWRAGWRSSAGRPRARGCEDLRVAAGRRRRTAPRAGRSAATPRAGRGAPGCRGRRRAAPGASARCPRSACRRRPSGRSSPSACAGRSSARSAAPCRPARAAALIAADLVHDRVHRLGHQRVDGHRVVAGDDTGARSRSPRTGCVSSSSPIRSRIVGFAIL